MTVRVLLVSTTGMGDCLWGTPGIRALKKTFPEIEIDLVVNKSWKSLFDFNPYLNKIFEYYSEWHLQPFLGIKLLRRDYDAIYLFHANRDFRRLLPWLRSSSIWCHQNFDWIPESHRMKMDNIFHGIQRRLIMLENFGVKPDGGQMEIFFDQVTLDRSQEILKSHNFSPGKYVYLNLGASVEKRRWKVEHFIELASQILKKTSWNIMLGGGGTDDQKRSQAILNQLNSPRLSADCIHSLMVSASIISQAGLMVTSNTGAMHIGLSVKTPVVALFGTISPTGSGPYEIADHLCRVITINPEGQDSFDVENPGEYHIKSIPVNRVWEQVEKMLPNNSSP
jgi:ADP-heptose:LPS heptosyltransferase